MVTLDALFTPIAAYKQHIPHYGTIYKGLVKQPYGYDEVTVAGEDVVCNVTKKLERDFAASRIARYWRAYCERRREKALATLRPALMHWAYSPMGPLGRRVIASLLVNNPPPECL
jgi:hypothetical protein